MSEAQKLAALIEAVLVDSYGFRDEILESAGLEPYPVEEYPESVELEGNTLTVTDGAGNAFEVTVKQRR